MKNSSNISENQEDAKKKFIVKTSIESENINNAFDYTSHILQFLSLYGLFINSFLSVGGLANLSNHNNSSGFLFLRGVNAINGPSGFFVDVLNFSSKFQKQKERMINEDSKKVLILGVIFIILFLIHPLLSLISDLILKRIGSNNKLSYLISGSISTIQAVLSILAISFFALSVGALFKKVNKENHEKLQKIKEESEEKKKKIEQNIKKRESIMRIVMLLFSLIVVFSFSVIHALILKKITNLSKILDKTLSQKMLLDSLTYVNYLVMSIIIILGAYLAATSVSVAIKKMFINVIENKEKKIKKKNTFTLSILFYIGAVGLFALSSYVTNIFNKLDPNEIGRVFGYDVAKTLMVMMGILANGLACYFIFKGIISLNDSEKLLIKLLDNDEKTLKNAENIIIRNKIIGASLIIASAIGTTGILSTLVYAEMQNLNEISSFIKKPEFLAAISMIVATFVLLGISFYGKANFLEKKAQEYKEKNSEILVKQEDNKIVESKITEASNSSIIDEFIVDKSIVRKKFA